jgi:D-alanyl-D-alanine carboxypeptidase (penicillin-binding protein 5/6)
MLKQRNGFFVAVIAAAAFCLAFPLTFFAWSGRSNENADAAAPNGCIVMRADDKSVIYGENIHTSMPMASTTKVMTALLVIENCKLGETVTVDKSAVGVEGSSVYLKEGEKLTVKELLYCLMLRSGNDSAVALAVYVAGSVENFVDMMNIRAESLGLKDTHFANPHGLENENHYTSCYDLCYLSCYAMNNPRFREIVGTKAVNVGSGESARYLVNKNKILNTYEGGNGVKTGYTKAAGRCLVAAAERNGIQLVSVVLNRYAMFDECRNLLDRGFMEIEG